ncbi:S8 family peptidase [Clostridium sp. CCUG 7971]|uniref:S8 family peptidase n=1 Tax=Clostridium sp. CCUG 7971 TaxID=2811414 RepID=UPI001ABA8C1D|nr:S8 family peptidase [Clostridium sp. CCUG 7971]MBO3445901.1 S8 family peptidase [Clostridium sp. CCUG 7971]
MMRQRNNIEAVNVLHGPNFEEEINSIVPGNEFYKLSDGFGVLFINENNYSALPEILSVPSVTRYEPTTRLTLLGDITQGTANGVNANEEIGVNFFKNNPNLSLTGRGVAIAIIGSGIDYLHPDFIYEDGTSKILYLWDQTKEGNPPKGYLIGTEYTREQINEAIAQNDNTLSVDTEGYGTMISGICAGLGKVNREYAGVAEDSDLIVVKMDKINGFYNNAMAFIATQYVYEKAFINNLPIVIDTIYGTNSSVGVSTRTITQQAFYSRGLCLVTAAGNEGNTQTHTSGRILFKGDVQEVEFELTNNEENLEIQVWIDKPDIAKVTIVTPTGETSKDVDVANYSRISGIFDLESTGYSITYIYPTTYSGQQQTIIGLTSAKRGVWKLRLTGEYITNGIFNVYLPNRVFIDPGTKFRNPDPDETITYPGTYDDIITVGAYNTINSSLWQSSSRGPSISKLQKPDIVAPGVNIIAPYPGGKYATITGTAPASAYASGCAALFLQYVLVERRYPEKAFVQKIRTYFRAGAVRDSNISYPNNSYGFGVLNIRNIFDQLR